MNKILTNLAESIAKALIGFVLVCFMGYVFVYLFVILLYLGVIPLA